MRLFEIGEARQSSASATLSYPAFKYASALISAEIIERSNFIYDSSGIMPGFVDRAESPKRKRSVVTQQGKPKKRVKTGGKLQDVDDPQARILLLETQILESRRHYNNIATLLEIFRDNDAAAEEQATASVALCRVFCRLMAAGSMSKTRNTLENEAIIVKWLKERYNDYTAILLETLRGRDPGKQVRVGSTLLENRLTFSRALH